MEREMIRSVYLYDSKGTRSVTVITDAPNEKIRGYVKDSGRDIGCVLRQIEMDGYLNKIVYDSNIDPEDVLHTIGYSISYDLSADTAEFDRGKNWLFERFSDALNGTDARIIDGDDDCMVIGIKDCETHFMVKIEEG